VWVEDFDRRRDRVRRGINRLEILDAIID
jgi:hypothetical protein